MDRQSVRLTQRYLMRTTRFIPLIVVALLINQGGALKGQEHGSGQSDDEASIAELSPAEARLLTHSHSAWSRWFCAHLATFAGNRERAAYLARSGLPHARSWVAGVAAGQVTPHLRARLGISMVVSLDVGTPEGMVPSQDFLLGTLWASSWDYAYQRSAREGASTLYERFACGQY